MAVVNFVGAGRLGQTLARLIATKTSYTIGSVLNSSSKSTEEAVHWIGAGRAVASFEDLSPADLTFIATPDQLIAPTAAKLTRSHNFRDGSVVVHCSGALPAAVLHDENGAQFLAASAHPMHSFAEPSSSVLHFEGTYCTLEGAPGATRLLADLFTQLGAIPAMVDSAEKSRYHAAGVIASNYLVTLTYYATQNLELAGIPPNVAKGMVDSLMRGTLDNLSVSKSCAAALTGPLQRGDQETLRQHLCVLEGPSLELYKELAVATLPLTHHPPERQKEIATAMETEP